MDLDSAIQHCKEQVQEQAKKGCYSCAEEHQQLAEWLKELKAYRSRSEIPNTCGDAVSRAIVQEEITKSIELRENPYQLWYRIRALPSVTPQQRTARWKFTVYDSNRIGHYECTECHWNVLMNVSDYCPHCGAKMEVDNG